MSKPKNALLALRIKAKKTRRQMAAAIGITESAIYLWETGRNSPKGANLVRALEWFRKELGQPHLQASDLL